MPGLYGFFLRRERSAEQVERQIDRMARRLEVRHPVRLTEFADDRFAVHNACFHDDFAVPEACVQMTVKRVFLDGYVLNREEIHRLLEEKGMQSEPGWDDETLVSLLYGVAGEGCVDSLHGSFNLCAYDPQKKCVTLINDRHGARHLYYLSTPDWFAFATEIKALVALDGAPRKIDRLSIQDMFNFGYIGGTRTFFEDIRLFEPGTILSVGRDEIDPKKYWDFGYRNTEENASFEELVEEGGRLIEQAVSRQLARFSRVGVPLSGGLDSRAILSFAARREKSLEVFHCAWYAREECIARQLCQLNQGNWHGFDPLQFDVAETTREGMAISDGDVHCHQFWFLPVVREIRRQELAQVLLDGYLMDVFFGDTFLVLPEKEEYSLAEKREIINGLWRRGRPLFVEKAFRREFFREYEEANRVSIEAGMDRVDEPHLSNFIHRFSFANRSNRYSVALPNVQRQYVEYGYPGLDYELTDFYLRLPPAYKDGARFYRAILVRQFPDLAQVPWIKTGQPLDRDKTWLDKLLGGRLPVRQLGTLGLLRLSGGRLDWSHRADLNRHFRQNPRFRHFFTEILEDPRTHSRGIIDREGARRLIRFVDRGWPVITLIQSLVTVELWFRQFVDE